MKILILTTHLDAGGITSYLYNLVKGLVQDGHRIVLVSAGGNRVQEFERLGIRLVTYAMRTKCEFSWRLLVPLFSLMHLIRKEHFDVMHAQTRVTQVLGTALAGLSGCPLVTTCHGFFQPRLSRRLWPCWGKAVIAISPQVREHLEKDFHVSPTQIHDVRSGIDPENFVIYPESERIEKRRECGIPAGPVIGIIARLSAEKGHLFLIRAMARVVQRIDDARLLIVGKGRMEKELHELVQILGLQNNVFFFAKTNRTQEFLSLLDIFILPSSKEGLGLSVMEAQAAGLPVIATRVGGIPNLIQDGHTGVLIDSGDEEALVENIIRLIGQHDMAQALGRQARDFIQKEGSYRIMAKQTQQVYLQSKRETPSRDPANPCRILVFNVNWIGDVIFTGPVFKALHAQYPGSRIICLAVERVRQILECMPDVDEVMVYDEHGRHRGLLGKIQVIRQLRKRKIDLAFILHRSWTRALIVFLARIPLRVGYDTKRRGIFLTHPIDLPGHGHHRCEYYFHILRSYGINGGDDPCELRVDADAETDVKRCLRDWEVDEQARLAVIHIGGNWELKRWPERNFTDLIQRLHDEMNMHIVIPGSSHDRSLAEKILPKGLPRAHIAAGKTNLKQLIALMARADVVISADSGPMHIANCVGTKVVALFGPTRPEITGPRGKGDVIILQKEMVCNREPCYNLDCPDNQCMQAITVDEVMQAVKRIMTCDYHQNLKK